ncbi:hypothetical protein EYF80_056022 [Liparis tanakae]|uniref:Uncharacterized protein n=1 Tax=Liparis tanakae TaxID=230148 RepID=A0A4Z2EZK5_9TELE|nr:hypothetical protein EYF80_056022 [Liparis tanakae]
MFFFLFRPLDVVLGPLEVVLGPLEVVLGPLEVVLGPLEVVLGPLEVVLGPLDVVLGPLEVVLGPLEVVLGPLDVVLGPLEVVLGPLEVVLGPLDVVLGPLDVVLGPLEVVLGPLEVVLGPLEVVLGPCVKVPGGQGEWGDQGDEMVFVVVTPRFRTLLVVSLGWGSILPDLPFDVPWDCAAVAPPPQQPRDPCPQLGILCPRTDPVVPSPPECVWGGAEDRAEGGQIESMSDGEKKRSTFAAPE